jgi:hypothetical protein
MRPFTLECNRTGSFTGLSFFSREQRYAGCPTHPALPSVAEAPQLAAISDQHGFVSQEASQENIPVPNPPAERLVF